MERVTGRERRGTGVTAGEGSGALLLSRPAVVLRGEGAALLAASVTLYWIIGGSWWLFALLLLAPDVSMLGYLAGQRIGAASYKVFHSYPLPAALGSPVCCREILCSPASLWCGWLTSVWTER